MTTRADLQRIAERVEAVSDWLLSQSAPNLAACNELDNIAAAIRKLAEDAL